MTVELNHVRDGVPGAPAVLLGAALGTDLNLFEHLARTLSERFDVVRFDTRGHGGSPAPGGPYSISGLAGDVVALADRLGIERFAYVGISIGGAIGLTLALEHPDRLTSLVACCTAARFGDPAAWTGRAALVRKEGLAPLVTPTTERWFTADFRLAHPDVVERVMTAFAATSPTGYAGCCDANADYDVTARLGEITVPTLVISGELDEGVPAALGRTIAAAVPGTDFVLIPGAAHLANLAAPNEFDAAVLAHLG